MQTSQGTAGLPRSTLPNAVPPILNALPRLQLQENPLPWEVGRMQGPPRFCWEERSRKYLPGSKVLKLNKMEIIEQNV